MLSIFIFTINAIFPIMILMALGYFLKRTGIFTNEFLKMANKSVFYVFLPVLLFKNVVGVNSISDIHWITVIFMIVVIGILVLLGFLTTKIIPNPKQKGVIMQCIFRSNFALIGVSLAELIAGENGVLAAAVLSAFSIPIYNIFAVVSLSIFRENNKRLSKSDVMAIFVKIIKNPLIIGVVLGVIVLLIRPYGSRFIHTFIPAIDHFTFLETVINYIARVASPLALLVLGGQFDFKKIQGYRKQIVIGVMGRNLLAPLIGVGSAVLLHKAGIVYFDEGVFASFIALFGTPVAVASAVMAEEMGSDGQLAGQLVVWTTLFSIVSIFIEVFAVRAIGLI